MGFKIIMAICMLPILPIMYVALLFISGEKNGMQFSVILWEGARESQQIQKIRKLYKRELNVYTFACFLLFFLTLIPNYDSLVITGQMVWMFFSIFILFVPFIKANKRMKEQKRKYKASIVKEETAKESVFVDVTAALAEKPKLFRKSLFGGSIFTIIPIFVEYFLHDLWHNPNIPDLWCCEVILLSIAAVTLIFPFFVLLLEKQRISVITCNSQINLQISRVRQYHLSKFYVLMVWSMGVFNWGLLLALHLPSKWFLWTIIAISFIFSGICIGFSFFYWHKIKNVQEKYLNQQTILEEDDEHWIWGLFYYNKNDNRSVVENRAGIGITYNIAKPKIKYSMIIIIAFLFISIFGICGWVILEEFTPVSISYQAGTLTMTHWKKEYQIKDTDIKKVTLLEEEPEISRRSGTGMKTVKKGDYYSSTDRRDLKVCFNPQEPPFLMIEMKDGTWYLFGGNHGEETRDIWQRLP